MTSYFFGEQVAFGRKNWMFAGSLRAGKHATAIMSLIHSTRINRHNPYEYMKDVLERQPLRPFSHIGELLPYNWKPA